MNPSDVLQGYSKGLYSSWYLYRPDRLLIDCGEGCATALGNSAFAIEKVLLTHGHIDHIGGLPSLIWARASAMGDNEKPLEIYYPEQDPYIGDMIVFLEKTRARISYPLQWKPLRAGDEVPLKKGRVAQTFPVSHMKGSQSLGYKILEERKRLKPQFGELTEADMRERAQGGTLDEVMEMYSATKIAFCGDSLPVEPSLITDAEVLLHEATILDATDRKGQSHSTVDEAIGVACAAKSKLLILIHLSGRYRREEVETAIRESATRRAAEFPIWCWRRERLWPVYEPK